MFDLINLALRDKKRNLHLVSLPFGSAAARLSLKELAPLVGAKGALGFASPALLAEALGATPGSVSPLDLAHAGAGAVSFWLPAHVLARRPELGVVLELQLKVPHHR